MSLDAEYPIPIKLKENELKTLKFLYSQSFIQEDFQDLANAAYNTYFLLNDSKKLKSSNFNFIAELRLKAEKKLRRIILGADIITVEERRNIYRYDMVSYSLSVCDKYSPPLRLIRRFHFDYAVPQIDTKQPVPTFHLQYGGKLTDYFKQLGCTENQIKSWLSTPRLNHYPLTLALLLDIVFCEFRNEITHRLVERREWRNLIKENEELVVKPYYEKLDRFVQSNDYNQNCLIRDYCYGKKPYRK